MKIISWEIVRCIKFSKLSKTSRLLQLNILNWSIKKKGGKNMIELKNISVDFEDKGKVVHAVDNVSLKINKGEVFGIVG